MESDPIYYADFVRRAGAALLDAIVISIPGAIAHLVGLTTGSFWPDFAAEFVVWLAYYSLFTASGWQATPGKHAFGIKVTDLEGRRIGLGRSAVRYFASWLSALVLLIGYLMVPFTRRSQAMHDMIAGTLVVDAATAPGAVPFDRQVRPLNAPIIASVATVGSFFLLFMWITAFVLPSADEREQMVEGAPLGPATGEPIALGYSLHAFPFFGGKAQLVKEGALAYRLSDVRVTSIDATRSKKRLAVVDGFTIAVPIYREAVLQGFALQLEKDQGFSWEWFDREEGGYVFRKLQGPGRIQVRIYTLDGLEEIAEILFLEDIALQVDRNFLIPFAGPATEQLVVKKGSLLKLMGSDSN